MRRLLAALFLLLAAASARGLDPGPAIAAAPDRYATLDGARIHYKILGRGKPTLVFIHGLACDLTVWREQAPFFANKGRVVLIDLPGFGLSDKPATTYSMRYFARAIRAVFDHARIERAILVGHSMGTPIIREFDRIYPAHTRALVAVDGGLKRNFDDATGNKLIAPFREADYQTPLAKFFESLSAMAAPEVRAQLVATARGTPQNVLVSSMEGMFTDSSIWKDDRITVPLLVINAKSPFWTPEYEAYVRSIAKEVDYNVMDGVDHFLMLEKPAEVNGMIEKWLRAQRFIR